jgi:hypothetical protein
MAQHGAKRIPAFDAGFDDVPGVERVRAESSSRSGKAEASPCLS